MQVGNDAEPEVGALTAVAHPVTQYVPMTIEINSQNRVERCILDLALPSQLYVQRIQIDDGVELLQRPVLPSLDPWPYPVGDSTDGGWCSNVTSRVASSIERQNLGLDLVAVGLVLLQ